MKKYNGTNFDLNSFYLLKNSKILQTDSQETT